MNMIERGRNYGWGAITIGVDPRVTERTHEGMEQPIVYYTPTIAPSGMVFYTGNRYRAGRQPVRQRAGGAAASAARSQRWKTSPRRSRW